MKKHFLILMLMALLPMAGWAVNLSDCLIEVGNVKYGGNVAPTIYIQYNGDRLRIDDDYTWDGKYYTDNTCLEEAGGIDELAVGEYYVKIVGVSPFTGEEAVAFNVQRAPLKVTAIAGQDAYVYKGDPVDTEIEFDDITFDIDIDEADIVDPEAEGLTFTCNENTNAGTYAITGINGLLTDNYEIEFATNDDGESLVNVVINPMELTANDFTVTAPEDVVYAGANLNPAFSVVYKAGTEDETVLTQGVDFTVANTETIQVGQENVPAPIYNAGDYEITITGKGNYSETLASALTVAPAPLKVYANNLSKVYDGTINIYGGTAENPIPATVAYSGLVGADANVANPFDGVADDNGPKPAFAVNYVIPENANYDEATAGNMNVGTYSLLPMEIEENSIDLIENYDIEYLPTGKLTVTAKAIAIKPADNLSKEIDSEDAFTANDIDVSEAIEGDRATLASGYKIVRSNTDEAVDTYEGVLSLVERTDLEEDAAAAFAAVKANYTIDATGTADFEITGGTLYVYPKSVAIVYGQPTPTTFDVVATTAAGTEIELKNAPSVIFKDLEAAPTAAGTYVLTLDAEPTVEGYTVVPLDGQYTISPKPITVTVQSQILQVGDDKDDLVQTKVDFAGKLEGDVIGYTLDFNNDEAVFANDIFDADGKLTEAADRTTWGDGIMIVEVASTEEAPNDNANYTIDWTTTGELVVGGMFGFRLESNDEDWDKIVKYDGEQAIVEWAPNRNQPLSKFEGDWKAKEWNTGILPFAVTVRELSNAFGYAIVNIADPANTTESNVAFKLEMGEIPANTPFAIKTDAAIPALPLIPDAFADEEVEAAFWEAYNKGFANFWHDGGFTIEKPESQVVETEVAFGHKFVGVYKTETLDKTKSNCHFLLNGAWKHIGPNSNNTFDILPLNCYIESPAAAAARGLTFTFEELDGSTTAIKAISVEASGAEANAKGWYSIGGMKLQGVPAQKGVYINNGKKVIIK